MARNNKKVQMATVVDTRTGMIMAVETADGIIDLRPYGATFESCPMHYDGPLYEYD